jgi:hypothetical protein
MMYERDKLLEKQTVKEPVYIVTPTPMLDWMREYTSNLKFPHLTVLVPSSSLNPEQVYYY